MMALPYLGDYRVNIHPEVAANWMGQFSTRVGNGYRKISSQVHPEAALSWVQGAGAAVGSVLESAGHPAEYKEPAVWVEVASLRPSPIRQVAGGQPPALAAPIDVPDQDSLQGAAAERLRQKIPAELYRYFDVYLYVSKAAEGSLAQHMYVFSKDDGGNLSFEQSFPVSTGRERHEKYFTTTPVGLFELDPHRFERSHYSRTWHARMPWTMFLDATIQGRQTGIALHSAGHHIADLGSRASGGCVRLPPQKAAELFHRFKAHEFGVVPVFAFDPDHNRTNGDGVLLRNDDGSPVLRAGYKVLLYIEDFDGGPAVVAVL